MSNSFPDAVVVCVSRYDGCPSKPCASGVAIQGLSLLPFCSLLVDPVTNHGDTRTCRKKPLSSRQ